MAATAMLWQMQACADWLVKDASVNWLGCLSALVIISSHGRNACLSANHVLANCASRAEQIGHLNVTVANAQCGLSATCHAFMSFVHRGCNSAGPFLVAFLNSSELVCAVNRLVSLQPTGTDTLVSCCSCIHSGAWCTVQVAGKANIARCGPVLILTHELRILQI